jgi:hypothetical protein
MVFTVRFHSVFHIVKELDIIAANWSYKDNLGTNAAHLLVYVPAYMYMYN